MTTHVKAIASRNCWLNDPGSSGVGTSPSSRGSRPGPTSTSTSSSTYSAAFKTAKYHPSTPERFGSLEDARAWAQRLFTWYNYEHYHTSLALLTPAQVHQGLTSRVLAARKRVLAAAYAKHPERFVRGEPAPAEPRWAAAGTATAVLSRAA
ncbi:MAG: transposase [Chloroflexales bacterium]|nr:transposase [Chloroflexales bacterium]